MIGNIRTFDRQTRMEIPKRMERVVTGICSAFDCGHNFDYTYLYPVTINDSAVTSIAREASLEMFGNDVVIEAASEMAAEDFSFFEEVVPGSYFFLGCGNSDKETDNPHHSSKFNIDDNVLPLGVSALSGFAFKFLTSA